MRIIPAIDLIDGKCVRLVKGDYDQKTIYNDDPVDMAMQFQDHGVKYLHLVDLDGAKAGKIINHRILEAIASNTGLIIDFGGGIRSAEDVQTVFDYGGDQAVIGSLAFRDQPLFWEILEARGPEKIVLGADARQGKIAVGGWLEDTGIDLDDVVDEYSTRGVKYFLCTDIEKDGMMEGPSFELYRRMLERTPEIALIASGGIRHWGDVEEVKALGCEAVIIGKAIYENKITLKEIEKNLL